MRARFLDSLTWDEKVAWCDRDPEGYSEWIFRVIEIDYRNETGKKTPKHRFNKKNPKDP